MENYEKLQELGSGAFGTTYKVINKKTKEVLAMKCIRLSDIGAEIVSTTLNPLVLSVSAIIL